MWPIQTQDKLFHDGNGTTELGTVVTAEWLNDVQQALLMVLAAGGQTPAKGNHNLLRDAIQRIVNNHTPAASATVAGVVKLNDTLSSQSTTEALTANQGRLLNGSKLGNSGNQTIDGILSIASKNWGRLVMPTNDGGRWIFEVNPSGAADPRVNFGFAKAAADNAIANGILTAEEVNSPEFGNNPLVLKMAAYFGQQLGEDTPPKNTQQSGGADIQSLMVHGDIRHLENIPVVAS